MFWVLGLLMSTHNICFQGETRMYKHHFVEKNNKVTYLELWKRFVKKNIRKMKAQGSTEDAVSTFKIY